MNLRTIVAAIAGGITLTLVGWLVFGLALMNYFHDHMVQYANLEKNPPDWIPLVLFNIAFGWLIAFVFDYWAGIKTFATGAIGGIAIMVPIVIGIDFQHLAFMNLYKDLMPVVVHILVVAVMGAIAGGVVGLILGRMNK
jgi:hypothetical protein